MQTLVDASRFPARIVRARAKVQQSIRTGAPRLQPRHLTWVLAIAFSTLGTGTVLANPTGAQVASGQASIAAKGKTVTVTNTPGTIINWQSFSISPGETTNFVQQTINSTVLNRVTGADPSKILGTLTSNGKVILVNPNGVVFGNGAIVDAAGLVVSTLNITDDDFRSGKMRFVGSATSGNLQISGVLRSSNGDIYLIAPNIENTGAIKAENGSAILAAGEKVEILGRGLDNIHFEVQNKSNQAVNLGKIEGNAVGMFAGAVRQAGTVHATSVSLEGGKVVLHAAGDVVLAPGSKTVADAASAGGAGGAINVSAESGNVSIAAGATLAADNVAGKGGSISVNTATGDITVASGATISASGIQGGAITLQASQGTNSVYGRIRATGTLTLTNPGTDAATGGAIELLGKKVGVFGSAAVDASGDNGGGSVLVGGDLHGTNAAVQNADASYIGADALIRADARVQGNGGEVVVMAEESTQVHGEISALGGTQGGNGGLVETSGRHYLLITRTPEIYSRRKGKGSGGTWLLDPSSINIIDGNSDADVSPTSPFTAGGATSNLSAALVETALTGGGNVVVDTSSAAAGQGDINVLAPLTFTQSGTALDATLQLHAHGNINISANISDNASSGALLNVELLANQANSSTVNGVVTVASGASIRTGGGYFKSNSNGFVIGGTVDATGQAGAGDGAVYIRATQPSTDTPISGAGSVHFLSGGSVTGGVVGVVADGPIVNDNTTIPAVVATATSPVDTPFGYATLVLATLNTSGDGTIGSAEHPVTVAFADGGQFNMATAASGAAGDVHVQKTNSDLDLNSVGFRTDSATVQSIQLESANGHNIVFNVTGLNGTDDNVELKTSGNILITSYGNGNAIAVPNLTLSDFGGAASKAIITANYGTLVIAANLTANTPLDIEGDTVSLNGSVNSASALTMDANRLAFAGNFDVGTLNWQRGTIGGALAALPVVSVLTETTATTEGAPKLSVAIVPVVNPVMQVGTTLALNGSGYAQLALDGVTLNNSAATSSWMGDGSSSTLTLSNAAAFNNYGVLTGSNGYFNIVGSSTESFYNASGATLNLTGAQLQTALPFNNDGTINIQTGGTLKMAGDATHQGSFNLADATSTLEIDGGTQTFSAASAITGPAGAFNIDGFGTTVSVAIDGTLSFAGGLHVGGSGASVVLNASNPASLGVSDIHDGASVTANQTLAFSQLGMWAGGTLTENNGLTVGTLNLQDSGTLLNGTGALTVTTSLYEGGDTLGSNFSTVDITQQSGDLVLYTLGATQSVSVNVVGGTLYDGNGAGVTNITAPAVAINTHYDANVDLDTARLALNSSLGSAYITNAGALVLDQVNVGGNFSYSGGGDLSQNGAVNVSGGSGINVGTHTLMLDRTDNSFGATVNATAGLTTIGSGSALSVALATTDTTTLNSGSNTLNVSGTTTGTLNTTAGATNFTYLSVGGDLNVVASGDVGAYETSVNGITNIDAGSNAFTLNNYSDAMISSLNVTAGTVNVSTYSPLTLNLASSGDDSVNVYGGNSLVVGGATTGNLTTYSSASTTFGATTVGGNLSSSANGAIGQTGSLNVSGTSFFGTDSADDIALTDAGNQFGGLVNATGNNVTLNASSALSVNLYTYGDVVLSSADALTVSGSTTGLLSTTAATTIFGQTSVGGDLNVMASGAVSQQDGTALNVSGLSSIDAGDNSITLINTYNSFGGLISVTGGTTRLNTNGPLNVAFSTSGDSTLGTTYYALTASGSTSGNLTVNAGGATSFGATTVGNNLNVSAASISQSDALRVGGTTSLNTGGGDISLTNTANSLTGPISLSGGNVALTNSSLITASINDYGTTSLDSQGNSINVSGTSGSLDLNGSDITLGALHIGNSLSIDAGGPISQSDTLTIGGNTSIDSHGNPITLDNSTNQFYGQISISGGATTLTAASSLNVNLNTIDDTSLTSAQNISVSGNVQSSLGGNLSTTSAGSTTFGATTIGGTLSVHAGSSISQSEAPDQALTVGGLTLIETGSNNLILDNSNNQFNAPVSIVAGYTSIAAASPLSVDLFTSGDTHVNSAGTLTLSGSTAGSLIGSSTADINAGPLSIGSNLYLTAGTSLSQSDAITVAGTSTLTAGTRITLDNSANQFSGAVYLSTSGANDISLANGIDLILGGSNIGSGALHISAQGNISEYGPIIQQSGAAPASISASGNVNLTDYSNDFTGPLSVTGQAININTFIDLIVSLNSSGDDTINLDLSTLTIGGSTTGNLSTSAGAITFNATSVGGNLSTRASGSITQNSAGTALTISGTSYIATDGRHDISLTNAANQFGGLVNATGGNISLATSSPLSVNFYAYGNASFTADLNVTGSAGGNLTTNGGATDFGYTSVGGNLTINASGPVSQDNGTSIYVGGTTSITASGGTDHNSVTLDQYNNLVGTVSLSGGPSTIRSNALTIGYNTSGDTTLIATYYDLNASGNTSGSLNANAGGNAIFGTTTVGGNLNANASNISQTDAISVAGSSTLNASTTTLTNASNQFAGTVNVSGGSASLVNNGALNVSANNYSDVTLDSGANALSVSGSIGGSLTTSAGTTSFGNTSVTYSLNVNASGPVSQTGPLSVYYGTTTINAGANSITLDNGGNTFWNAVNLTGATTTVASSTNLTANLATSGDTSLNSGTNSLNVSGTTSGNLSTTGGATSFGTTMIGADLSVSASGQISQNGSISVGGMSSINAGNNSIYLTDNGNEFTGAVNVSAGYTNINSASALTIAFNTTDTVNLDTNGAALNLAGSTAGGLNTSAGATTFTGNTNVAGNLNLTASGALLQTAGNISVSGTTYVTVGSNSISLASTGNQFVGSVSLNNSGANDVALANGTDLIISSSNIGSGALYISAQGNVSEYGPIIQQSGAASASISASGNVNLTDYNNDFTGPLSVTGLAININTYSPLVLALSSAGDDNINVYGNNSLTISGSTTGSLAASDSADTTFGMTSVGGNLSSGGYGLITQTGALNIGGTSSFSTDSSHDVTLTNVNNQFGGMVNATGNNISLVAGGALSVNLYAYGGAKLTGGGMLFVSGSVAGDLSTVGAATDFGNTSAANLSVNASGAVTQDSGTSLYVPGTTTIDAGDNSVTLDQYNNLGGMVSLTGGASTIRSYGLDINFSTSGDTTLTAIYYDVNASGSTSGSLSASAGNNVVLGPTMIGGNLNVSGGNSTTLGAVTVGGDLNVSGGYLGQSDAISIAGVTNINIGSSNVLLDNGANSFGGPVNVSANQVTLSSAGPLAVSVSDYGDTTLNSGSNALSVSGNVGGSLMTTGGATTFGTTSVTYNLTANASGPVSQTGPLSVYYGSTTINAGTNSVTLDNIGNVFWNAVNLTGGATTVASSTALTANLDTSGDTSLNSGTNSLNVSGSTSGTLSTTGGATSFGDTAVGGDLMVSASGNVSQYGMLNIVGMTNIAAGSNSVNLTDNGNVFGAGLSVTAGDTSIATSSGLSLMLASSGDTSINTNGAMLDLSGSVGGNLNTTAGDTMFGATNVGNSLNVSASGAVTQSDSISVAGTSTFNANSLVLDNGGNLFAGIVYLNGGSASLTNASDLTVSLSTTGDTSLNAQGNTLNVSGTATAGLSTTAATTNFGQTSVGGDLNVMASGAVSQQDGTALNVSGLSSIDAGDNSITLINTYNSFGGLISVTGGTTRLNTNGPLNVAFSTSGDSTLGTTYYALTASGSTSGNLTVNAGGATSFGATTVGNNLNVSAASISQSDALRVGGTTSLNTGGGDISLTNTANSLTGPISLSGGNVALTNSSLITASINDYGTTSLDSQGNSINVSGTSGSLDLNGSDITLGALHIGNSLSIDAGGPISQSDTLTIGGNTSIDSHGNPITLDNSTNQFYGQISISGGATTLTAASSLNVNLNTIDDTSLTSAQNISVSGNVQSSLGGNLSTTSAGSTTFGATTIGGTLSVHAGSSISQSEAPDQALTVGGLTLIETGSNNLILDNSNNQFNAPVSIVAGYTSIAAASPLSVDLFTSGDTHVNSAGTLTLSGSTAGSLIGSSTADINAGPLSIGSNLYLTAGTSLSQSDAITVAGTSTLTAGTRITLDNSANQFSGAVYLSTSGANDISLANGIDLILGGSNIGSGALHISAQGNISEYGPIIQQSGAAPASISASGNVNLTDYSNDFTGPLSVTGQAININTYSPLIVSLNSSGDDDIEVSDNNGLTIGGTISGNLFISSQNGIIFNATHVSGGIRVSSFGSVTQNDALEIDGASTIDAGTDGDINLGKVANRFVGKVNVTGINIDLAASDSLDVVNFFAYGSKTTLFGNASVAVGGYGVGDLSVSGGSVILHGGLYVGNNLSVNAGGAVTQDADAGIYVVGSTTINAGHNSVTLDQYNNFNGTVSLSGGPSTIRSNALTIGYNTSGDTTLIATYYDLNASGNSSGNLNANAGGNAIFGATTVGGNLNANASTISQTDAISVAGSSNLNASTTTLTNASNQFAGTVSVSGGSASLVNNGALDVTASNYSDVTLNSGSNALSVSGNVGGSLMTTGGATTFGTTSVTYNLTANASGPVSQTGPLSVYYGVTTINAGTNSITLDNGGNTFWNAVNLTGGATTVASSTALFAYITTSGDTSLNSGTSNLNVSGMTSGNLSTTGGATNFGATVVGGDLMVSASGDVSQYGPLNIVGMSSIDSGDSNIYLTDAGNVFGAGLNVTGANASINTSNDLSLMLATRGSTSVNTNGAMLDVSGGVGGSLNTTAGDTLFGATSVGNSLNVSASGAVTQSDSISVAGTSTFNANSVVLDDSNNSFASTVYVNRGNASLTSASDLTVSLNTTGDTRLNAQGNTLTVSGNTGGLSTTAGTTVFRQTNVSGDLNVDASGTVRQQGGASLYVRGMSTIDAGDNVISLGGMYNSFGGLVSLTGGNTNINANGALNVALATSGETILGTSYYDLSASGTTSSNLTVNSGGGVSFGTMTVGGNLSVTSSASTSQSGAVTVGGKTNLRGYDINLTNAANSFAGLIYVQGRNVAITSGGDITASINDSGSTSLDSQGNGINVSGNSGSLSLNSGAVILGALILNNDLTISAGGPVSQSDVITVGGITSIDSHGNTITLDNSDNQFFGQINITGGATSLAAVSALNVNLDTIDDTSLTAQNIYVSGSVQSELGGNLTLTSNGATTFGAASIGGTLNIKGGGSVSQSAAPDQALSVGGLTLIEAGNSKVILDNAANQFNAPVSIVAGTTSIASAGALTVDLFTSGDASVSSAGTLTVSGSTAGSLAGTSAADIVAGPLSIGNDLYLAAGTSISQSGTITVAGTSTFITGTSMTLDNVGNQFSGTVYLNNSGSSAITLVNGTDLILGNSNIGSGTLHISAQGNISENGPVVQQAGAAPASISATGNVNLTDNNNDFTGLLAVAGQAVNINAQGPLVLALSSMADDSINVYGSNSLTLSGMTTGNLNASAGGAASFGATSVSGNLSASSGGTLTQTDAIMVQGSSTFNSGSSDTTLTNANNLFTGPVSLSGFNVALTNNGALNIMVNTVSDAILNSGSNAMTVSGSTGGNIGSLTITAGATTFGATSVNGGLHVNAAGNVTQTDVIGVGSGGTSINAHGHAITLNNTGNQLWGPVSLTGGATSLAATTPLTVSFATSGDTDIYTNQSLTVSGTTTGHLNTTGAATSIGATTVTGNLVLLAGGNVSQSDVLDVGGTTTINAMGSNVNLGNSANLFGGAVNISAASINLGSADGALMLSLSTSGDDTINLANNAALNLSGTVGGSLSTSAGATTFGATSVANNLTSIAGGAISQTAALTVGGDASVDAGSHSITLDNSGNHFGGSVSLNNSGANDIALVNVGNLTLASSIVGSGMLTISAAGNIMETGPIVQATSAAPSSISATGSINLSDDGNNFTGPLNLKGQDITIRTAHQLSINLDSSGNDHVNVDGADASAGLTIGGSTAGSLSTTSFSSTTVSTLAVGQNLNISAGGNTVLGSLTVGGSLTLASGGALTQTDAIQVNGASMLTSGGDITLTNGSNLLSGPVNLTGINVALTNNGALDATLSAAGNTTLNSSGNAMSLRGNSAGLNIQAGAINLGATSVSDDLSISATGDVAQTGALNVSGSTTINASAHAIALNNVANQFGGTVSLSNSGNNNVVLATSNALRLDNIHVGSGLLALKANGISQTNSGSLTEEASASGLNLDAGSGSLSITNAANQISAPLQALANGDIVLASSSTLTLAGATAGGNISVTAPTLNVTGNINGSVVQLAGSVNTNVLSNIQSTELLLGTASGNLTIGGGAAAPNITSGKVTLNGSNIAVLGSTTAGRITSVQSDGELFITTAGDLTLKGGSAFGTAVSVVSSGNATINVGGTLLIQGGSGSGAYALLDPAGPGTLMSITANGMQLVGGTSADAYALVRSGGDMKLTIANALTLSSGTADGTHAVVMAPDGKISYTYASCTNCAPLAVNPFSINATAPQTGFYDTVTSTQSPAQNVVAQVVQAWADRYSAPSVSASNPDQPDQHDKNGVIDGCE